MKYTFLFDFDGTLVDSMPTYISAILRVLDENHIPYGNDIVKIVTPLGLKATAEYCVKLGLDMPVEKIVPLMEQYMLDAYLYTIPPKKHVIEVLRELTQRGASLNILTASPHVTLDACLKRLGIFDRFDNVWSCNDFGTTKADPEIYKMAAKALGKNTEDILFLDDNVNANKTAKSAGMVVCGVYDESSKEYTEEMKAVTNYYIDDFSQLLDLCGY